MADKFSDFIAGLTTPAQSAVALTPNDTADLAKPSRGLFIGVGGTVVATLLDDAAAVTFPNLPNGSVLPIRAKRVWASGTTATNILSLT